MMSRIIKGALALGMLAVAGQSAAQPVFVDLATPFNVGATVASGAVQDVVYYQGSAFAVSFGANLAAPNPPITATGSPSIVRVDGILTPARTAQVLVNATPHYIFSIPNTPFGGPTKYLGRPMLFNNSRGLTSIDVDATGNLLIAGNPGGTPVQVAGGPGMALRVYDQAGYLVDRCTVNNNRSYTAGTFWGPNNILAHDIGTNFDSFNSSLSSIANTKNAAGMGSSNSRGAATFKSGVNNFVFVRRTGATDRIALMYGGTEGDISSFTVDPTAFFVFGGSTSRASAGITHWSYGGKDYIVCIDSVAPERVIGIEIPSPLTVPLAASVAAPAFSFGAGTGQITGVSFAELNGSHYALVTRQSTPLPVPPGVANAIDVYGIDGAVLQATGPTPADITKPLDYDNPDITVAYSQPILNGILGGTTFLGGSDPNGMAMDVDAEGNLYIYEASSTFVHRINADGTAVPFIDAGTLAATAGLAGGQVTAIEWGRHALFVLIRDGAASPVPSAVLRVTINPDGTAGAIASRYVDNDLIDVKLSSQGSELFIVQTDGGAGSDDNIFRVLAYDAAVNPAPAPATAIMTEAKFIADTGAAAFNPGDIELDNSGTNVNDLYVYDSGLGSIVRIDFANSPTLGTAGVHVDTATLASGGVVVPATVGVTSLSSDFRGALFAWDAFPTPNTNGAFSALAIVKPNGTVRRLQLRNTAGGPPTPYFTDKLGEAPGTNYQTRFSAMSSISYVDKSELYILDEVGERILKVTFNALPPVANGDANGDMVIDLADVTDIYNFAAGITLSLAGDGDINNNGSVTAADGNLLVDHLVNGTILP